MQLKMNNPDQYSAEFLDLNRESINELATFAQIYEGFTLAFAEVNFAADVQVLLKALKNHHRCQGIQLVTIEITDSELEFVLKELKEGLQQTTIEPDKKIVIVALGLERAIGFLKTEKTPKVLDNLNFARNVFTVQLPYPVIFVLPDYALTKLARGARDFWAWASAVIAFRSGRQMIEQVHLRVFEPKEPKRLFGSDDKPVKQERIDLLQRLLTQYQPTLGKPDAELAPLRLNILDELADAYFSLTDMKTARHFYTEALSLAQLIGEEWTQANVLIGLGRISAFFKNHGEALDLYKQALDLYKVLDDRLGEANTLQAIGDVLQFQDQYLEALNYYDEALSLFKTASDRLGEANTLKAIGDVLQFQDQHLEALNYYDEALKIFKGTSARLSAASTLVAIGDVLQFLKQSQEALNRYDEALKIFKDTGEQLGEANTLRAIGDVLKFLDQHQEALNRYDEALKIFKDTGEQLGEANTLSAIGDVLQFFKQSQKALNHYEEALSHFKNMGERLGEVKTLVAIGDALQFLKQSKDALNRYDEALKLSKTTGNRLGEANTLKAIADVLVRQENLDENGFKQAVAHLETAYSLYCDIGDRYSQARILLTSIAPLRFRLEQRELAISAITQAAQIAQEIGYEPMQQYAANWLKALEQEEP